MTNNDYLNNVLKKYKARDLKDYLFEIVELKLLLKDWASSCFIEVLNSGSRAKGTAINIASDVDYMVSLTTSCNENNGGLKSIYDSLYTKLVKKYGILKVRKQNVSFRIILGGKLEVDITPARKHSGNTNYHWIYVSKKDTWKQTNISIHINDIYNSGRTNEIKLLKIWRELNNLDFPSIYIEYLIIKKILYGKPINLNKLSENFLFILKELSKDIGNPLYSIIIDPANTSNILSDLLTEDEKKIIINKAKISSRQQYWRDIVS